MTDKITILEKEIKKIEDQLEKLMHNKAESGLDKKIQGETASLLKNVIDDLRRQQEKLITVKKQGY